MTEGATEMQPTDRESMLRSRIIPRAMNLCKYLDTEGIKKIEDGHAVGERIRIPLGPGKIDIEVSLDVRKAT